MSSVVPRAIRKYWLLLIFGFTNCVQASQVEVVVPQTNSPVNVGNLITFTIDGNFANSLYYAGLNLSFDPNVIRIGGVTTNGSCFWYDPFICAPPGGGVGGTIGLFSPQGVIDNTNGVVSNMVFANYQGGQPANTDFNFVTVYAFAVGVGTTDLLITANFTPWGALTADLNHIDLIPGTDFSLISSSITVVPIPAAFWLLGSGILFFFGTIHRKQIVFRKL